MESMYVPLWLKALLSITTFFSDCEEHTEEIRRECNMFCFECRDKALCFNCMKSCHKDHQSIQIRRSSYHDVVRMEDIQNELDISGIQPYVINGFNVVFLNKRDFDAPKTKRAGKSCKHTSRCETCRRNLADSCRFCSLGCKFVWIKKIESENESESESTVLSTNKAQERAQGKRKMEEEEITKRMPSRKDEDLKEQIPKPKQACPEKILPKFQQTSKASSNSNKRKGIPRRAPFY